MIGGGGGEIENEYDNTGDGAEDLEGNVEMVVSHVENSEVVGTVE